MRFDGKVVLVTGAASGIGRAASLRFAELGARLHLADLDAAGLGVTAAMIRDNGAATEVFLGDMSRGAHVADYVAQATGKFGGIDVLCCNAGIQGPLGPIYSCGEEEFDRVIAVNTRSVFLGLRHVLPVMMRQGRGSVVVTCSVASLNGVANLPAYVASKHAALGLVRAAAVDVAQFGVRVNAVCPGAVDTPMLASVIAARGSADIAATAARFASSSPTGKLISSQEVADAMAFLSSDHAKNITGTYLAVDGGLTGTVGNATRSG
jgi:NAD(P)-dependent dehydrogenase (short-subunit alcohol dehydrogenase family)